ncbi:dual oxidase maturation factor 1-like isoform X2 [Varroa jacobsoni]|uniref:Dual oxidase maturation factor 1 n=1 Tax=Varroa destructor TaxID=109461 RepID=A0A7M7J1S7_VARDE|nr:dual oxidase maturation factor 1-like isoform X2 [Varroa destructor]XP_022692091.1 dual oxidase maturation factor 1-like isoform X2 [Varroa jacobsoni]
MTAGWFDAWRDDGGPALHADPNRTHVTVDTPELFICIAFATLFIAFLIIVPGIRKERITTVLCVTVSLAVGASILTAIHGGGWHVAHASTNTYFKAFTDERLPAQLGVCIGLAAVNVTYAIAPESNYSTSIDVHFNERFHFTRPTSIQEEYKESLVKGLPYPILTVLDYLRQDSDGFTWGRAYRKAGFWASYFLWWSFALWLLSNLLLCAVPRYGAYLFSVTGLVMLVAVWIYAVLLPNTPLIIPMENGSFLKFDLGWCFYMVLVLGIVAFVVGTTMAVVDTLWPSRFSTILEVDYDTPYRYFVGQGYSNSRCPSLVATPHSTITARTSKGQEQLFKVLEKLEDELSEMSPSEFGDDNSEFGGRDNAAYDGSSEVLPCGSGSRVGVSRATAGATSSREESLAERNDTNELGEEFEMVDGKRAITLQDFGKFANRMATAARTQSTRFGVVNRHQSYGGTGASSQHSRLQPAMSLVQRDNGTTTIQISHTLSRSGDPDTTDEGPRDDKLEVVKVMETAAKPVVGAMAGPLLPVTRGDNEGHTSDGDTAQSGSVHPV